jgi:spermidine/putrescine transport system permease protein
VRARRVLAVVTGAYIVWSVVPVLLAIRFAFNDGRSRTSTQGWSLRWFWEDANLSVFNDPTLQQALVHSLELAAVVMLISVPLGAGLALGMRQWSGRGSSVANTLLLLPLVTPELLLAVGLFLLFTTAFDFIGLGTTAQAIGQAAFTLSWVVLIVRVRLATIGPDVEEAAADLGAPPLDVARRILLPMLAPALAASLLISFALSIDDFVVSQYLASGADTTTVPMRIYAQARGAPTPALNALASLMLVVSLLALVLAYVLFRLLTRGEKRGAAVTDLTGIDTGGARA